MSLLPKSFFKKKKQEKIGSQRGKKRPRKWLSLFLLFPQGGKKYLFLPYSEKGGRGKRKEGNDGLGD